MLNNILNFVTFLLVLLTLSCSGIEPTDESQPNSNFSTNVHQAVTENNLAAILSRLSEEDSVTLDAYKIQLLEISDKIRKDENIKSGKLIINSYVKSDIGYTHYKYINNTIEVIDFVPEHINNSFNNVFVCYSPDYWEKFPKRVKSVTFPFDTLNRKLRFEVVQIE
jgi:hypothetical protein